MTLAWHSVVQGYLHCLTVHFLFNFSGGKNSRGVVSNFLALLNSLNPFTNPVHCTAAQAHCHSIASWGRAGVKPVLLLGFVMSKCPPPTRSTISAQQPSVQAVYHDPVSLHLSTGDQNAPRLVADWRTCRLLFEVAVYCDICKCTQSMG